MSEQIIEVEAESLEEAREQIKSQMPEGFGLISERVVLDGIPKTIKAIAETTEAAFAKIQNDIPNDANILEKKELTAPARAVITIEVFDEQMANSLAESQAKKKFGEIAIVKSLKLAMEGNKGFLGIGKKPHRYEAEILQQAVVEVTYKSKAKISALIGNLDAALIKAAAEGKTVEDVKNLLDKGADVNAVDEDGNSALKVASEKDHTEVVEILIQQIIKKRGLSPLGHKKRFAHTESEYIARLLLFRDKSSAETYYQQFISYAKTNPSPCVLEILLASMRSTFGFPERQAVIIPHNQTDIRPEYQSWAMAGLNSCNNIIQVHRDTAATYEELLYDCVDIVLKWTIIVPKYGIDSSEVQELLWDFREEDFEPLKVLGQEGVTAPPDMPDPKGPWVGLLFEIARFNESLYGKAATELFFEILDRQHLSNCIIRGGDILPECEYWCMAIHTSSEQQTRYIEDTVRTFEDQRLAPVGSRLLHGSEVPVDGLSYLGFVSSDGRYVGRWEYGLKND